MVSLLFLLGVIVVLVIIVAVIAKVVQSPDSGVVYHNDGVKQSPTSEAEPVLSFKDLGLNDDEIASLHNTASLPANLPEGVLVVENSMVNNALEQALQNGKNASGLITQINGRPAIDVRRIADPQQRAEIIGLIQQLNGQSSDDLDLNKALQVVQYISKQL